MSILIDENTKIVVQGLSGFQAKFDTQGSLRYGSNVVAGVVPGRKGETVLDLPMYNTVKEAVDNEGAEATVIYVPASGGKDAILEAADAGIKLAVVVSEKGAGRVPEYPVWYKRICCQCSFGTGL